MTTNIEVESCSRCSSGQSCCPFCHFAHKTWNADYCRFYERTIPDRLIRPKFCDVREIIIREDDKGKEGKDK